MNQKYYKFDKDGDMVEISRAEFLILYGIFDMYWGVKTFQCEGHCSNHEYYGIEVCKQDILVLALNEEDE